MNACCLTCQRRRLRTARHRSTNTSDTHRTASPFMPLRPREHPSHGRTKGAQYTTRIFTCAHKVSVRARQCPALPSHMKSTPRRTSLRQGGHATNDRRRAITSERPRTTRLAPTRGPGDSLFRPVHGQVRHMGAGLLVCGTARRPTRRARIPSGGTLKAWRLRHHEPTARNETVPA